MVETRLCRGGFQPCGDADDAMLVTQELYDKLLKEYEELADSESTADLDYDPVSAEFIGKKWMVVVDYHD